MIQTWPLAGLDEALLIAGLYLVVVFAGSVRALCIHEFLNPPIGVSSVDSNQTNSQKFDDSG